MESLREMWDTTECTNMCITQVSEEEERGAEKLWPKSQIYRKNINLHIQEA